MPSSRTPPPQRPSGLRGGSSRHIAESLPLLGPDGQPLSAAEPSPAPKTRSPRVQAIANSGARVQPRQARRARRAALVQQLYLIGDAINSKPLRSDDIAYLATILINATLPYENLGEVDVWIRRNKDYDVTFEAGYSNPDEDGHVRKYGLPFGILPRRILSWINTRIVRTGTPNIEFDGSFADWVREALHLEPTGGATGSITRAREQMSRLINMKVSVSSRAPIIRKKENGENEAWDPSFRLLPVEADAEFWNPDRGGVRTATRLCWRVSPTYFKTCLEKSAPLVLEVEDQLAKIESCLAIDLYRFITVRQYHLFMKDARLPELIPWTDLMGYLGQSTKRIATFRTSAAEALDLIRPLYPRNGTEARKMGLLIRPETPHVPAKPKRPRLTSSASAPALPAPATPVLPASRAVVDEKR